jgi:hypothetical protein
MVELRLVERQGQKKRYSHERGALHQGVDIKLLLLISTPAFLPM